MPIIEQLMRSKALHTPAVRGAMGGILFLAMALTVAGCAPATPTPNDFPPPPATLLFGPAPQTALPSPAPRPRLAPTRSIDLTDAWDFFLVTKAAAVTGDSTLIAERVFYPLNVTAKGRVLTIVSADDFEKNFAAIFTEETLRSWSTVEEKDLSILPDGNRVGAGSLWLQRFCSNAACTETEFRITQINS